MGPAQAARHIRSITAHELSVTAGRRVTVEKLNKAIADVVDAFTELDLIKAWGDGSAVAADGTQVDTFIDNLLAEASIRYGGTGGTGHRDLIEAHYAPADLAVLSPYVTARIQRFGVYATDEIALTAEPSTPTWASTWPPHPELARPGPQVQEPPVAGIGLSWLHPGCAAVRRV